MNEQLLESGRVYRTAHLRRWSANPTRLAAHLTERGALRRLSHGLYYAPRQSRFGETPPSEAALLETFLNGSPYVLTGPARWNALGLGSTALFAHPLVYNMKRSGKLDLGGRTFLFRQVAFPLGPTPEWFVVDLLRNAEAAGASRSTLEANLARAVAIGRFDADMLLAMASRYGRLQEQDAVRRALAIAR